MFEVLSLQAFRPRRMLSVQTVRFIRNLPGCYYPIRSERRCADLRTARIRFVARLFLKEYRAGRQAGEVKVRNIQVIALESIRMEVLRMASMVREKCG